MIEVACVAETMAAVTPDPPHPLSSGGPMPPSKTSSTKM
jgi:hypothetical protein